jgi:SAM-dependent methyltransferase
MAGRDGAGDAAPSAASFSAASFRAGERRRDAAAAVGRVLRASEFPEREDSVLVPLLQRGAMVARSALDDGVIEVLQAAHMVRVDRDGSVTPLVRVEVWEGLLIAHDTDRLPELTFESVLGVNPTTRTMACLTPRRPVGRALDLGTGTGALALRMAGHAEAVVATDLNPHAAELAALNAAMNGVELDLRVGDLFDPVRDDGAFDLITANLPFAVSPDEEFAFRDGSRPRDGTARDTIVGCAGLLASGGVAVVLCDWLIPRGADPWTRPVEWVAALGCQALVVHAGIAEPEAYASFWNEYRFASDPADYVAAIERWTKSFDAWDVEAVAHGFVVLHNDPRSAGSIHRLATTTGPSGEGGRHVIRLLGNLAWLRDHGEASDLLAARPRLIEGTTLHQTMRYDTGWTAGAGEMTLADSAGITGDLHQLATTVVLRLDGTSSVQELVAQVAAQSSFDPGALADVVVASVHSLISSGCLEVA